MRSAFFPVSNFLPISLEFAEFAISYLVWNEIFFYLLRWTSSLSSMHLIEQQQVRKRTHAPSLSLCLCLSISLWFTYLLACVQSLRELRAWRRRRGGGVQREEVIISAAILKAHAWRLFPWKSSPCLPLHLSFMEEGSRPIVRKHELFWWRWSSFDQ